MQFATLLFYSVASLFLGLIAVASGGAAVLQSIFDPGGISGSHEPWQTILDAMALAVPAVFLVLAIVSIFRPSGDAPATAAEIRALVAALEGRNASKDRGTDHAPRGYG